jgi:hypothetical protein
MQVANGIETGIDRTINYAVDSRLGRSVANGATWVADKTQIVPRAMALDAALGNPGATAGSWVVDQATGLAGAGAAHMAALRAGYVDFNRGVNADTTRAGQAFDGAVQSAVTAVGFVPIVRGVGMGAKVATSVAARGITRETVSAAAEAGTAALGPRTYTGMASDWAKDSLEHVAAPYVRNARERLAAEATRLANPDGRAWDQRAYQAAARGAQVDCCAVPITCCSSDL